MMLTSKIFFSGPVNHYTVENIIDVTDTPSVPNALGITTILPPSDESTEMYGFNIQANLLFEPLSNILRIFVATHEIGHATGAKHIVVNQNDWPWQALMGPNVDPNNPNPIFRPRRDDILLVNQIYK
jgi:hypothetical protein